MSVDGVLKVVVFTALIALCGLAVVALFRCLLRNGRGGRALSRFFGRFGEPTPAPLDAAGPTTHQFSVYRSIIEASPDSIFLCRDGVVSFVNAAGRQLLGARQASEIEGQSLARFIHPDYQILCDDNFAVLIGETAATPMRFVPPSGRILDVLVSATIAAEDDGTVLVVIRNISGMMRANRDVAAQAKRLNSILDTAVDAIVVSDEHGRIETFNRSAEMMFGYASQDVIGIKVDILLTDVISAGHENPLAGLSPAHRATLIGADRDIKARRRDGSLFPAEISLSVCHLDDRSLFTAIIRDVTERRNFEHHLAHSATHDELTGLPNRRGLQEQLQRAIERTESEASWVAVCFVDLDGLKVINDVMGYAAGDELLVAAGRRMVASVGAGDTVVRFGGDEFTLILPGITRRSDLVGTVEYFLSQMTRPYVLCDREVTLNVNVGIALYPEHALNATDLVVHASAATMAAKMTGWNQFRFYDPVMLSQATERLILENELRRGIERNELLLQYQPQVDLKTGRVIGLEALVRWNHPERGLLSPLRFIPIAEQTGLIVPLGQWVLQRACLDLKKLEDIGIDNVSVAVNISPHQFNDTDILSVIRDVIEETGITPTKLDVEITESTLMQDPEHIVAMLERMKSLGVRLSIDDFGTGFSSLNYLKRFPVDTLKMDRSFVMDIAGNPKDEAIAITIITLAHSMGMTVLAEGVEDAIQTEILRRHGCDLIQGFYYSRPVDLAVAIDQIAKGLTPSAAAC
jgi:diguanylate cyclase (GGDEF)-like protein/PAS domain S-box-containing protein